MKNLIGILLTFVIAHSARAEALGGTVENGGTTVLCRAEDDPVQIVDPNSGNHLVEGWSGDIYFLDYLRALSEEGYVLADFPEIRSWKEGRGRLERVLKEVSPRLYEDFVKFAESTRQIHGLIEGQNSRRSWRRMQSHLIFSSGAPFPFPNRCNILPSFDSSASLFATMRAITRRQTGSKVEYLYDPNYLSAIRRKSVLQYTMLLTHEWLWDYTDQLKVNQSANAFLNSRKVERMSPAEIQAWLHELGLKF